MRRELVSIGKVVALFIIGGLLQAFFISRFSIFGVTADLFVILTVCVGFTKGSLEGAIFGFVVGLIADIIYYQPLGMHALIYVLVGYSVGLFISRFDTVNIWAVLVLAGAASFFGQLAYGIILYVIAPRAGFFTLVWRQMIPEAVLDGLIAIPVYFLLVRIRILTPAAGKAVQVSGGSE